jgi:hypothetical protein
VSLHIFVDMFVGDLGRCIGAPPGFSMSPGSRHYVFQLVGSCIVGIGRWVGRMLSKGAVLAMRASRMRILMEGGSSVVISPLMKILRDTCKSHHEFLVGDRRRLLALDVGDVALWRNLGCGAGGSRVGTDRQLSVVFQDRW